MCYSSVGSLQGRVGAASYHDNILRSGHGSVLETATWGFVVCGASRGYLAQQTRHRAGFAYAAESSHFTHYAEEGKGTVEPGICVTGLPVEEATFVAEACRHALKDYATLWKNLRGAFPADAKIKKLVSGAARGLLPTAIECKLGFTVNARALRHLCETRGNAENTLEIRLVVAQLAEIMKREAPAIFQDFTIETADDGYPVVVSKHKKV
jgi:thymidylate synthase (FAD)